ncbi:MAG: 6-phosphofructokinase, partial [Acidobacteria bacterium]|nr:6-phosphofructokinase [Acidobacteriota bacterium]
MAHKSKKKANATPRKIAVVTGGGDCPGLNAVVRAVVISALNRGWEIYGIERGFEGLLHKNRIVRLESHHVRGIIHTGGTILGTTNRGNPFKLVSDKKMDKKGKATTSDVSAEVAKRFKKLGFDAMIVIGGDGTLRIAAGLADLGMPVVGVPKTIDNDLAATELTFGFSTAITTATDAIDKLHATAASHERVMVVEVMG